MALLAPGQGSQAPGMFTPWLELPDVADKLDAWSTTTGLDLRYLGTEASAEEIKDTAVTQPLVVALSLIAASELLGRIQLPQGTPIAGHSVGELAAAAIAGVLSYDDAVALAAVRGRAMAAACSLEPTGMAAVMGGDESLVLSRIEEFGLEPANVNGGGQIVAAGPQPSLEKLADNPPEGARVRPLAVAGAFHTSFMQSAQEELAAHATSISVQDAQLPLLSNADGGLVSDGHEVLARLVNQVTRPVRWDCCMATLAEMPNGSSVSTVVELPPAGALSGLARRGMKGVKAVAVKSPQDLAAVADSLS